MLKTDVLRFAESVASRDVQFSRTASIADLTTAITGYASCRAVVGLGTRHLRADTIAEAVETYQATRGLLFLEAASPKARTKRPTPRRAAISVSNPANVIRMRFTRRDSNKRSTRKPGFGWCGQLALHVSADLRQAA